MSTENKTLQKGLKTLKNGVYENRFTLDHQSNTLVQNKTKTPHYKLTYFAVKGVAESIRFLLCYMEADWEEYRVELTQWTAFKPNTPWRLMPILEEDEKVLTQTLCILRYLGKKAGLTGDDDWENAQIDSIADTLVDIRIPASAFMWERNLEVKKRKKDIWINETLPFHLKKLDTVVKENRGYLANGKLSWVDFLFVGVSDYLSYNADVDDMTVDYPNLHALRDEITSLPQVANWISKRPQTLF